MPPLLLTNLKNSRMFFVKLVGCEVLMRLLFDTFQLFPQVVL